MGAVILITSLFSGHTHSLVGMMYFLLVLMSGFNYVDKERASICTYSTPTGETVFSHLFKKKAKAEN